MSKNNDKIPIDRNRIKFTASTLKELQQALHLAYISARKRNITLDQMAEKINKKKYSIARGLNKRNILHQTFADILYATGYKVSMIVLKNENDEILEIGSPRNIEEYKNSKVNK